MKKRIRLTESDIHRIVKESINRVLNEVTLNGNPGNRSWTACADELACFSHGLEWSEYKKKGSLSYEEAMGYMYNWLYGNELPTVVYAYNENTGEETECVANFSEEQYNSSREFMNCNQKPDIFVDRGLDFEELYNDYY